MGTAVNAKPLILGVQVRDQWKQGPALAIVPVPDIAKKLTIKVGKNAGKPPSIASLHRALAKAENRG
ncbi:hypothetical protein [Streptomyces sp. NPDC006267]|uniref:hypothetical protein n=1 Tax=Streptomyces sp. NPDC006267 TaxID=3157173 RepID=UPI0033B323B2